MFTQPIPTLEFGLLLGLYLWDYTDSEQARTLARQYQPFPLPSKEDARYSPSDVSIVVPTIDWDETLPSNLITWLTNNPREVIFVTVDRELPRLQDDLESAPGVKKAMEESRAKILVLSVPQANKRTQLCRGIDEATGNIIALVDDDALWTTQDVLINLLAPFQDENIGLVGGPIESHVPKERQNSEVITGWEVAALRIRQRRENGMAAFYAADGSTNFTVSGLTMLLRAEIVKDPYFQHLFTNDMWNGMRQNTGDDGFITRYILYQHHLTDRFRSAVVPKQWRLGIQLNPEARVLTSLMRTSAFAHQSKRWYRSGLRLRLTCLIYEPGYRMMKATAPYMTRKMAGGMLTPIFTIVRAYLWYRLWANSPWFALALLSYVLYNWFSSLYTFYRRFPYCGSKIWAAMIADNLYLVADFYSWATLSTESWTNRSSV
ncbi:glycosyltransferase family 2 protein [Daldinia vernicosa]|uniref:glycosyltransferase family 2 protein n=1 Tax=Daldinia vernicosa TaxID=114800 RepID=UPI0020078148|nr:glycosyltransferase family 2 protein [Daldinia vernicosa]KAI0853411.1 glycosyltransferase family 2 protein [Daldinia vernicosa]